MTRSSASSNAAVQRSLQDFSVPFAVRNRLVLLVDTLEKAKSQLKSHISERKSQIEKLTSDLETARTLQTDDGLVKLFYGGSNLLQRQADDIKKLKSEMQNGKDQHERSKRSFTLRLVEKDNRISEVEGEKDVCREAVRRLEARLAALTSGSPEAEADLKQQLAKSKQHGEGYRSMVDGQQMHIEKLTKENAKLAKMVGRQHFDRGA